MADISKIKPNGSSGTEYDIKDATARSALENKANNTQTFTEASTRTNIASGETMSTLFGKIKKFFTDLKTVAFTGSYNDLTNKPTIPAAQIQSDWNQSDNTKKDYIKNKPTIPTVPGVVSTSANGLAPKITNTSNFLKGDGTWSTPANNAVTVTNRTGSSYNNAYPVIFGTNAGTGTVTEGLQKRANSFTYNPYSEKLSVYQETVESTLKVGVGSGTNGYIDLYNSANGNRGEIVTDTLTANRDYTLPNESGTLATREYLNSNLRCNKLDSFVTITNYTASNKYTFPDDGYLWFSGGSTSDSNITLAGSNGTEIWCTFNTNSKPQMVFVRKGMKCWLTANSSATVRFFKLYD